MFFIAVLFLQHVVNMEWKLQNYNGAVMVAEFASARGDEKMGAWPGLSPASGSPDYSYKPLWTFLLKEKEVLFHQVVADVRELSHHSSLRESQCYGIWLFS